MTATERIREVGSRGCEWPYCGTSSTLHAHGPFGYVEHHTTEAVLHEAGETP